VLEQGKPQDRNQVIIKLRGQMLNMARHKFASNVCEKALVTAGVEERRILIDEIIMPKTDGVSPIVSMMKDQFASALLYSYIKVLITDRSCRLCSSAGTNCGRTRSEGNSDHQDPSSARQHAQILERLQQASYFQYVDEIQPRYMKFYLTQRPIVERLLERTINASSKASDKPADYPSLLHKPVN
jgi:pumilio RNA-binding family